MIVEENATPTIPGISKQKRMRKHTDAIPGLVDVLTIAGCVGSKVELVEGKKPYWDCE